DLHAGGPLVGADGGANQATPIAALTGRNRQGNLAFDPTRSYAFGFDVVAATYEAKNVNLDPGALADYRDMVANDYTTLLVGTATFKGTSCVSPPGSPAYDFSSLPAVIHFRLGWKAPTGYRNMQNPALTGEPFPGEEHPRGIETTPHAATIAQATFHLDHVF